MALTSDLGCCSIGALVRCEQALDALFEACLYGLLISVAETEEQLKSPAHAKNSKLRKNSGFRSAVLIFWIDFFVLR